MSEREELRLVTDFSELKLWDVVVVKDCQLCGGGQHRAALSKYLGEVLIGSANGWSKRELVWAVEPQPDHPGFDKPFAIGETAVAQHMVYKVENGLTQSSSRTHERKLVSA